MDNVESTPSTHENDSNKKSNGHSDGGGQVNGVSNGYSGDSGSKHHKSSSSSHKDKHRDRDHKKDHKSSRDKDRDKHSSSKDKEKSKDHKSSSSSRDKDKDRDRDKDRERTDKDKHRSKDRHHDDKKSSSSKDHKSSHGSSSRDKDKEHKSSSSSHDRDKHKHSSSSSSKDKDKDRHGSSSKDKDRSKSSSSSSKHHSSSSSKDKDRHRSDKTRDKDGKSDRDKSKYENGEKKHRPTEKVEIKEEQFSVPNDDFDMLSAQQANEVDPLEIKNEPYSYNSRAEDMRNISAASSCDYSMSQFNKSEPDFKEYGQLDVSQMNGDGRGDGSCADEEDGDYQTEDDSQDLEIKEESQETHIISGSDDDLPLASRASTPTKRKIKDEDEDDDEDIPLMARKKVKKEKKAKKRHIEEYADEDEDDYEEKPKKKKTKVKKEIKQEIKHEPMNTSNSGSPKKRKKKEEPEQEVWKWWEEEKKDDGTKWKFLEHKGPVFAPPYEPLPDNVKFYYDGKEIRLSQDAEEVAGFYARMLDHDYTSKEVFNNNFFKDWRKTMTEKEKSKINDLKKCNFKQMQAYFLELSEKNRNRTKEEKEELKKNNAELLEEYGFCFIDGHKEKIGNFKIEPPGLFRGRGEHPKMGMLKKRVMPEDVSINCSKDSKIPSPPPGHKWKDVRHDPTVTWLASWTENVQNQVKYVMLNPSSKLKGEKDWQKYETARRLAKSIDKIRKEYREDWKSKEMRIRQRAVALYFIDKLALRAGNEKDEDQADTVGCCSLRVEHISLHEQRDGKEYVVVFDFLGKDSIRYYNEVPVEKRVFKNLQLFMENKSPSDDLFDRLNTAVMNKHLNELMEGLTAKVFRTYNASWTLQQQLDELTNPDDSVAEKILSYNRANRAVAILCNHQRSVPKGHAKSMEKLKEKIEQKRDQISEGEQQVKDAKRAAKGGSVKEQVNYDKKKKMLERLKDQLKKLEVQETDRDENKSIALGTSKLNYLDPRISVAWCKKNDVPIEKIYNKTQRDKFRWAIDMATADYVF